MSNENDLFSEETIEPLKELRNVPQKYLYTDSEREIRNKSHYEKKIILNFP
jgi:hypothetical protein